MLDNPHDPEGQLGATVSDYATVEALCVPALQYFLHRDRQPTRAATHPAFAALLMASPPIVHDQPELRALAQGAFAMTDGRRVFIDARWLRDILATTTDIDQEHEHARQLERAYAAMAAVATGQPVPSGVQVVPVQAVRQVLESSHPDPAAAIAAAGYELPFNPVAQALARARGLSCQDHPRSKGEFSVDGYFDPTLAATWQGALEAAPPVQSLPDSCAGQEEMKALAFLLDGPLDDWGKRYRETPDQDRQPVMDRLVHIAVGLPSPQRTALFAAAAVRSGPQASPVHSVPSPWMDVLSRAAGFDFQQMQRWCELVASSENCEEISRESAVKGVSYNLAGAALVELMYLRYRMKGVDSNAAPPRPRMG